MCVDVYWLAKASFSTLTFIQNSCSHHISHWKLQQASVRLQPASLDGGESSDQVKVKKAFRAVSSEQMRSACLFLSLCKRATSCFSTQVLSVSLADSFLQTSSSPERFVILQPLKWILELISGKLIWKVPRQEVGVTVSWGAAGCVKTEQWGGGVEGFYRGLNGGGCCSKSTPTRCGLELLLVWNESGRASPRQCGSWFTDWRRHSELLHLCGFHLISCKSSCF